MALPAALAALLWAAALAAAASGPAASAGVPRSTTAPEKETLLADAPTLRMIKCADFKDSSGLSLLQTTRGDDFRAARLRRAGLGDDWGGPPPRAAGDSFVMQLLTQPGKVYDRIAVDVTYSNFWGEVATFPERRPRAFNVLLATLKTWAADLCVQLGERGESFDWKRSAAFAVFGFFYIGLVQWFFYVTIFTWVCPHAITFANAPMTEKWMDRQGQVDLVKQVCLDNFVLETLIYFPVFYVIKEVVRGGPVGLKGTIEGVRGGLSKYGRNFLQDNVASWAIWIPADVLIYAVPMFLRMPLDHAVSFAWTMVLSHMRGGAEHGAQHDAGPGAGK